MGRAVWLLIATVLSSTLLVADPIEAQPRPRYGGELVFLIPSEPPSYDGHREGTFGTVHSLAPHYNTLLRMDPVDRTGTRPVPDLAESWTISPDGIDLYAQAATGRPVPRRQSDDVARREGKLRQDHLPAGGDHLRPQGDVPGGGGGRGPRPCHGAVPAQVARSLLPGQPRLPLQLDLQGGHPGQGHALVRDERDGHGPVQVRRAREGLALGGEEEPGLLGQGEAVSRRIPRALHVRLVGPGGLDPGGARAHPVPQREPRRSRWARPGTGVEGHHPGEPLGLSSRWSRSTTSGSRSTTSESGGH